MIGSVSFAAFDTLDTIIFQHPPVTAGRPPACMQPKGPGTYSLLPRHGIRLFAPHGEGERFARLFANTWSQIPLGPRRSILRHWRQPCPILAGESLPRIELLNAWSGRQRGRGLRGDKAMVLWKGHRLRFWRPIVAAYPDNLVKDLIAHELAHVYQDSRGFTFENAYWCEEDADMRAEDWGFSATAIDEWDLANGVSKVIDLGELSRSRRWRLFQQVERNGR